MKLQHKYLVQNILLARFCHHEYFIGMHQVVHSAKTVQKLQKIVKFSPVTMLIISDPRYNFKSWFSFKSLSYLQISAECSKSSIQVGYNTRIKTVLAIFCRIFAMTKCLYCMLFLANQLNINTGNTLFGHELKHLVNLEDWN